VSSSALFIFLELSVVLVPVGISLRNKMQEAVSMRAQQQQDFLAYEGSLQGGEIDPVLEWQKEVQAWEANRALPNPYVPRGVSECSIFSSTDRSPRSLQPSCRTTSALT
jgi:hypothetical protein